MPFPRAVKARILVRCARICCLCFKLCGTRIEIAHIIAEADGGLSDDDNGVPVCFDCHEEIGSYNPRHPKGNRFTKQELKHRRDALYQLVEKGVIQAQIVALRLGAGQLQDHSRIAEQVEQASSTPYSPTKDATAVLTEALAPATTIETVPRKLQMLSERDRAYVMDQLVERFTDGAGAEALLNIIAEMSDADRSLVLLEQLVRQATLRGNAKARARLMRFAPINLLTSVDEGLRQTFFEDVIATMERDQYAEVNEVTPSVVRVQTAIPGQCRASYIRALIAQARSGAWEGAPAAQQALATLPEDLVGVAFDLLDARTLFWQGRIPAVKGLLQDHRNLWPATRKLLYEDYLSLDLLESGARHLQDNA